MRILLACAGLLLLLSCNSYKKVKDKELQVLNDNIHGKFIAEDINLVPTNNTTSIQELFGITSSDEIIELKVNGNSELEIHYKDSLDGDNIKTFKGKFKKKFFKVFLEKKRITLPPVYWVTSVNRLNIGLDKEGRLIINKHYDHSGMILLLAAGNSFDYQYIFKQSKK